MNEAGPTHTPLHACEQTSSGGIRIFQPGSRALRKRRSSWHRHSGEPEGARPDFLIFLRESCDERTSESSAGRLQIHHLDLFDRVIRSEESCVLAVDHDLNGTANLVAFNVITNPKWIISEFIEPARDMKSFLTPTRLQESDDLRCDKNAVGQH